ncbi:MAG TPA: anthranilate synthase component I [Terriglobales bacterium]|nr:anthranilate synthase component I [Terriglobales bacterium]
MLRPQFKEFQALSRHATLVPVVKTVMADLLTPVSAFLSIASGEPEAFLLESVERGERIGRYTFLGVRPYAVLEARGEQISLRRGRNVERSTGKLFDAISSILREHRVATLPDLPPFTGGAVGFVAYDAVRQLERLPEKAKNDLKVPDCILMFFDRVLAFDHLRKQIHIMAVANVRDESPKLAYERALKDITALERKLARGVPRRVHRSHKQEYRLKETTGRNAFLKSILQAKEYIRAGDAFQIVLSQRMELEPGVPPFEIYRALRMINPSPYLYFLQSRNLQLLGSSPEMLVRVTGQKLEYRPIAGTKPRSLDPEEDRRWEQELREDEKERAEHVMLVDLGRNDLGRVSEYGSVQVKDFMFVERYSHVMHLVSAIEGKLRPDCHAIDAFAAAFPAGTLTGAPKVRAMQIIDELEPVRRSIYGGAVLYADFAGNLDSCIAIRTMWVQGRRAYLQAGAGIVADSVPEMEYQECLNKAKALLRAVGMARNYE